jgi:hypothetical protein
VGPKAGTPPTPATYSASAQVLKMAAISGTPFCEKCAEAAAGGGGAGGDGGGGSSGGGTQQEPST